MKKQVLLVTMATAFCFGSCTKKSSNDGGTDNVLLNKSPLFMEAPDFDKIKVEDYLPAFKQAMKDQASRIDSIVKSNETPTFENTIVAFEKSGDMLERVSNIFFSISSADATDEIRKIEEEIVPLLTEHQDAIILNDKLFEKIKSVYDNQKDKLQGEDLKLLEVIYRNFVVNGANLSDENKKRLAEINKEISSLANTLGNKISDGTNSAAVIVDSKDELSGLDSATISQAEELAKERGLTGKYVLSITNTTQQPILSSLDNRDLRRKVLEASTKRCEMSDNNDTREDINKIMALRLEKAKLLGFDCFSNWTLQDQMAGNADRVVELIKSLTSVYNQKLKDVSAKLQDFARKDNGDNNFNLEAYDWFYYANKYKKANFDIDENKVKEYFVLDSVLKNGVFYAANKLYGITFKKKTDIPVYANDVNVYEVIDKDGSTLALFYTDYFHRDTKRGGAWMGNFVNQSTLFGRKPVIYNVCNYSKPVNGEPALISLDDVNTLFHEFGHALHGMFASQKYPTLSGTNVARDFVEMPSQFNEHWALEPEVFYNYAKHYKTGEPMPKELLDRLIKSFKFDQVYAIGENLAAVAIDISWHTIKNANTLGVDEFETNALKTFNLYNSQVLPRYKSNYFRHILAGGYASAYYSYLWTEVLDNNIYSWFVKNGGMTFENGDRLRKIILSKGNSEDLNKIFEEMCGLKTPDTKDLLRSRGLLD